jgi:glycosyltransferase involved in cell wall biosynthesis
MRYFKNYLKNKLALYYYKRWMKMSERLKSSRKHSDKPRFVFTPIPIINNKYWAIALRNEGYSAKTLMYGLYSINKTEDYDEYFLDRMESYKDKREYRAMYWLGIDEDYLYFKLFEETITEFDIFCFPFSGGILSYTLLKSKEAEILKEVGCKSVILAYGADYFQYSKITDPSYRHNILSSYPEMGRLEYKVYENYRYWAENANFIMGSESHDGLGRWDMLPVNFISIDTKQWKVSNKKNNADGKNGIVKLSHSPNHRHVKGTEYILEAVDELKAEGYNIELVLMEKLPNDEVRRILATDIDIHIEQIAYPGYALSAIEGMACGLPVISNEESELSTRFLRRYSYLNECPIVSATPESIKTILKILIANPELRNQLGKAGRSYIEKYHSEISAKNIFDKITRKVWFNEDIDLMAEYHPLVKTSYNNQSPKIEHPLVENKIPAELLNTLKK